MYTNLKKEYDDKINNIRQILEDKITELQNEFDCAVSIMQANCGDHIFVFSQEEFDKEVCESTVSYPYAYMSCKFCGKSKQIEENEIDGSPIW